MAELLHYAKHNPVAKASLTSKLTHHTHRLSITAATQYSSKTGLTTPHLEIGALVCHLHIIVHLCITTAVLLLSLQQQLQGV